LGKRESEVNPQEKQAFEKGFKEAKKLAVKIAEEAMLAPYRNHFLAQCMAEIILEQIEKLEIKGETK
jgi:hypothetical protein